MCPIGPEANLLEPSEKQCHRLFLPHPILSLYDLEVIKATRHRGWKVSTTNNIVLSLSFSQKLNNGLMFKGYSLLLTLVGTFVLHFTELCNGEIFSNTSWKDSIKTDSRKVE
jgi:hypothetical protein